MMRVNVLWSRVPVYYFEIIILPLTSTVCLFSVVGQFHIYLRISYEAFVRRLWCEKSGIRMDRISWFGEFYMMDSMWFVVPLPAIL